MKKILIFIICIVLICAMPLAVFAEGSSETVPVVDTIPETEAIDTAPPVDVAPLPVPSEPTLEETISEQIIAWCQEHFEKILVSIFLFFSALWEKRRDKRTLKSVTTLNNNAVSVSESGTKIANDALTKIDEASKIVGGYADKISELLAKFEKSEEDKQRLEAALAEAHALLKSSRLANKALAAEVAKLITLANLPNSVKDDLYADFLNNVRAILEAENTEVKEDDGQEA